MLTCPSRPDIVEHCARALDRACHHAAIDFAAALSDLRTDISSATTGILAECVGRQWSVGDAGAVACSLYLLAGACSIDIAAAVGWHVVEQGCERDEVLIALSDMLRAQSAPRRTALELLADRVATATRSPAFYAKLADHYRDLGLSFRTEAMLRERIDLGDTALIVRLAEHWIEFQDWGAALDLLRTLPADLETAETTYMRGRCAAALLLQHGVEEACRTLGGMAEPGPRYQRLLDGVWRWRIGETDAAIPQARDEGGGHPLIERDAKALRTVRQSGVPAAPTPTFQGPWYSRPCVDPLPNTLAIGMQRTATSWLWKMLRTNPDVQPLTFKETTFFNEFFRSVNHYPIELRDRQLDEAARDYWEGPTRCLPRYRALYRGDRPVRMDASPSYAELPEATVAMVRRILGPETKIILSVRDPVERSWSNLKLDQRLAGKKVTDLSFDDRTTFFRTVASARRSDYTTVLDTWMHHFENMSVIFYDDVQAEPERVIRNVCTFLGTDFVRNEDLLRPVHATTDMDMPKEDRAFLFDLHQQTYERCEERLGGPALLWRQRQMDKLGRP